MLERLSPLWRNLALALVGVLVLWFAWTVRAALNPLLLAFLVAYMLHPLVLKLERRGWSRKLAVNVIFAGTFAGMALLLAALVLQGRILVRDLTEEGPGGVSRLEAAVERGSQAAHGFLLEWGLVPAGPPEPEEGEDAGDGTGRGQGERGLEPAGGEKDEGARGGEVGEGGQGPETGEGERGEAAAEDRFTLAGLVRSLREWLRGEGAGEATFATAGGLLAAIGGFFGSLLAFLTLVVLVPLYTWFLLFELERIGSFVRGYVPVSQRERAARIGGQMAEMLGNFFRGRMLVCLLKGLLLSAAMAIAGVPYALLLGMLSGFLSLVPFAGPGIGYLLAFLVCLLEFSPLGALLRVGIVAAAGEVIEGYVLVPKVLGDSLGLHPVVVLASLTIFGSALGMFGVLLALPLTAAVVILGRELVLPALKDLAEGRSRAGRKGLEPGPGP